MIIEYITEATPQNLYKRFLRKNTKDELAWTLARMWEDIHGMEEGDRKKRLIEQLLRIV